MGFGLAENSGISRDSINSTIPILPNCDTVAVVVAAAAAAGYKVFKDQKLCRWKKLKRIVMLMIMTLINRENLNTTHYAGEKSQSLHFRFLLHLGLYRGRKKHMWDHVKEAHEGEIGDGKEEKILN
jgi:hypothetical protein